MENINPITREEIYNVLGLHFSESSIKTFPATTSATLLYIISRKSVCFMMREIDNTYHYFIISSGYILLQVRYKSRTRIIKAIEFHFILPTTWLCIRFLLLLLFNASNNNICIASPLPFLTYVSDVSYGTAKFFIFHYFSPISANFPYVVPTWIFIFSSFFSSIHQIFMYYCMSSTLATICFRRLIIYRSLFLSFLQ